MTDSQRTSPSALHLHAPRIAENRGHFGRHAREAREAGGVDVTDAASIVRGVIDAGGYAFTEREDGQVIALFQSHRFYVPSVAFRRRVRSDVMQVAGKAVRARVLDACELVVESRAKALALDAKGER